MSNLAIFRLTAAFARQSLGPGAAVKCKAPFISTRSASSAGEASSKTTTQSKTEPLIPASPFLKKIAKHSTADRLHNKTPEQLLFRPILKPEQAKEKFIIRTDDYKRSFDRKDLGRKPKPRLEVPPVKFRIAEMPENYTVKPLRTLRTGGRHPITGKT